MSFQDLWLLRELISQSFNNLLNNSSFNNFTLQIFIDIFIRIPIRFRRADHGCSFFLRIVQALNIFLGIDDDIFIEGVICIFFWGIASFAEKFRVIIDKQRYVLGCFLQLFIGIDNLTNSFSCLVGFFCVLFSFWVRLARLFLTIRLMVLVEVFVANKYFIALHLKNINNFG